MSQAIKPSIKFGVVGLGQCGGNLTEEFYLKGYACLCLNSSRTDLRAVKIPTEKQFYVGLKGRDGAGQDMDLGRIYLERNAKKVLDIAMQELLDVEHLIVTAGLGGGTGSNAGKLVEILSELDKPITVICTLPWDGEGSISKVNAMKGLDALIHSPVESLIIIDNQKIRIQSSTRNPAEFYRSSNRFLVDIFDRMNRISRGTQYTPLLGFGSEDLRQLFMTKGVFLFGEIILTREDLESGGVLLERLKEVWDKGGFLTSGFDLSQASAAAVILLAPQEVLAQTSAKDFEVFTGGVKDLVSSCAIYNGIFMTRPGDDARLFAILCGLPLPARVDSVLRQAKSEGKMLSMKITTGLQELDLSGLDDINIFQGRKHKASGRQVDSAAE